jgi:hypothetical protein
MINMEGYYKLKKDLTQRDLYGVILAVSNLSYNYSIKTSLDKLEISDIDEYTLDLYNEYQEIRNKYEKIGFLYIHDIKIESLNIIAHIDNKNVIVTFYENVIWTCEDINDLQKIFRYLYLDPDKLIGNFIHPNFL